MAPTPDPLGAIVRLMNAASAIRAWHREHIDAALWRELDAALCSCGLPMTDDAEFHWITTASDTPPTDAPAI